MNIIQAPIAQVIPYENNPRKNSDAVAVVAKSLKEYGWQQPIVVDKSWEIIVGHTRYLAATDLGYSEVPVVVADKLTPEQVKAYRIMDNKSGEFSDWDQTLLIEELQSLLDEIDDFEITGYTERELFDMTHEDENPYTHKIVSPVYEPKGVKPNTVDCYDDAWAKELLAEIENNQDITSEERELLTLAAYRHTRFDFENIAEYYCHASPECQKLMQRSAMIIIDFDQAIELGYVKLSKTLAESYGLDHSDES